MRLPPRFSVIALVLAVPLVPVASGADIPSDWAYRAVKRPDMPRISDQNLIANPIDAYLLDKAVYELGYELNNRPDWLRVPLAGIEQLLGIEVHEPPE